MAMEQVDHMQSQFAVELGSQYGGVRLGLRQLEDIGAVTRRPSRSLPVASSA